MFVCPLFACLSVCSLSVWLFFLQTSVYQNSSYSILLHLSLLTVTKNVIFALSHSYMYLSVFFYGSMEINALNLNEFIWKVETIGDAYMLVSGLPLRNGNRHAGMIASAAWHLLEEVTTFVVPHKRDEKLKLRIGIHSGTMNEISWHFAHTKVTCDYYTPLLIFMHECVTIITQNEAKRRSPCKRWRTCANLASFWVRKNEVIHEY